MKRDQVVPSPPSRHLLDNRIPPPVVALVMALLMALLARVTTPLDIAVVMRIVGAGAFIAFAGFMGARAFAAFGRAGTTINPINIESASALVTVGAYRISRNPMYVALTSLLFALACGLANPWTLVGPLLFALFIDRFQIRPEERVMHDKFGEAYREYQRRVRRWL